jgi:hypothetical protein
MRGSRRAVGPATTQTSCNQTSAVAIFAVLALVFGLGASQPQRGWQVSAAEAELCAVAMTLLYFRPTLVRLFMEHAAGLSVITVRSTVDRWVMLSRVRIVLSAAAWLAALRALALR